MAKRSEIKPGAVYVDRRRYSGRFVQVVEENPIKETPPTRWGSQTTYRVQVRTIRLNAPRFDDDLNVIGTDRVHKGHPEWVTLAQLGAEVEGGMEEINRIASEEGNAQEQLRKEKAAALARAEETIARCIRKTDLDRSAFKVSQHRHTTQVDIVMTGETLAKIVGNDR